MENIPPLIDIENHALRFIHPFYQNQGYGQQVIHLIEEKFMWRGEIRAKFLQDIN